MKKENTVEKPLDLLMWVGKRYYTIQSFIEEAKRLGVTKRISSRAIPLRAVFRKSRVFLVHDIDENDPFLQITRIKPRDPKRPRKRLKVWRVKVKKEFKGYKPVPKIFGYFIISSLLTVGDSSSEKLIKAVKELGGNVYVVSPSSKIMRIKRGCGYLAVGGVYLTDAYFELKYLKEKNIEIEAIEGAFTEIKPWIEVPGLKRFRAWMYVDGDKILARRPMEEWIVK